MRKFMYAAAAAAALATASVANAAVTVNSGTVLNLDNPNPSNPMSISTSSDGATHINFGQNDVSGNFMAAFTIHNTMAGLYDITVGISDGAAFFDTVTFNGTPLQNLYNDQNFRLIPPITLGVGDYVFALTGHAPLGGSFTGNATVSPAAVPEATTWAMMLLGFGAMGIAIRRRRRPTLAQLA